MCGACDAAASSAATAAGAGEGCGCRCGSSVVPMACTLLQSPPERRAAVASSYSPRFVGDEESERSGGEVEDRSMGDSMGDVGERCVASESAFWC